jgi:hypothetical protein
MNSYVVVLRARASAIFYPGDQFTMNCVPHEGDAIKLTFRTTYDENTKFDAAPPVDLWAEARGQSTNLHRAGEVFGNAAMEISTIIALSVTAYMGVLQPELIFDESPNSNEHEFFQSFIPNVPRLAIPARRIDLEILTALVRQLAVHRERKRLLRAAAQYVEALQSWRLGREISCVAHLYMGVEALTKAVVREHMLVTGKTQEQLGSEWGIDESMTNKANRFDSEAKRRLIFRADAEAYESAKNVSDGFEHGYRDFDEIRKPARDVIVKMAGYLRRTIIETSSIDNHLAQRALGPDYEIPRGPLVVVRYLYGTLVGKAGQLAPQGCPYPSMTWETNFKNVLLNEKGVYSFVPDEKLTANFADGVQLRPTRYEVWDGSTIREATAKPLTDENGQPVTIQVIKANSNEGAREVGLRRFFPQAALIGSLIIGIFIGLILDRMWH